ncbi:hypothetical protein GCM10028818_40790 [Spirosoma horti]
MARGLTIYRIDPKHLDNRLTADDAQKDYTSVFAYTLRHGNQAARPIKHKSVVCLSKQYLA